MVNYGFGSLAGEEMPAGLRAVIRAAFWLLGVLVSVFPALHAAHVRPTFDFVGMAQAVNHAGLFRDLFFVVIIVSIVSFTNLLDNIFRRIGDVPDLVKAIATLLSAYYLYVLVYGTLHFADLAEIQGPVSPNDFAYDYLFIKIVLGVSLLTEVAISLADNGTRERERRSSFDW